MTFTKDDFLALEKGYRTNLVNSVTGFKSANLIGTVTPEGHTNLAIFSSVIHVGANPPLIGLLFRPVTVARHTYENIKATGVFTLNHVSKEIFKAAHQTSARYEDGVSEFEAVGLTPWYSPGFAAPFVAESTVKIGLKFVEEVEIKANGTLFMVGEITELILPEGMVAADGYIDIEEAGTVAISGLDSYHTTDRLARLSYAKPDRLPEPF